MKIFSLLCVLFFLHSAFKAKAAEDICTEAKNNNGVVKTYQNYQPVSTLTLKKAQELFKEIKKPTYRIPYYESTDKAGYCSARTYKISHTLFNQFNISTLKAVLEAKTVKGEDGKTAYGANGSYAMETLISAESEVTGLSYAWEFHTVPAVCVQDASGTVTLYVFDVVLFSQPVPHKQWVNTLTQEQGPKVYERNYVTSMYEFGPLALNPYFVKNDFLPSDLSLVEDMLKDAREDHLNYISLQNLK